jgi:hypothetical protein
MGHGFSSQPRIAAWMRSRDAICGTSAKQVSSMIEKPFSDCSLQSHGPAASSFRVKRSLAVIEQVRPLRRCPPARPRYLGRPTTPSWWAVGAVALDVEDGTMTVNRITFSSISNRRRRLMITMLEAGNAR